MKETFAKSYSAPIFSLKKLIFFQMTHKKKLKRFVVPKSSLSSESFSLFIKNLIQKYDVKQILLGLNNE